jgi:hypothetical protein
MIEMVGRSRPAVGSDCNVRGDSSHDWLTSRPIP